MISKKEARMKKVGWRGEVVSRRKGAKTYEEPWKKKRNTR